MIGGEGRILWSSQDWLSRSPPK